jgi:hypothetical protein
MQRFHKWASATELAVSAKHNKEKADAEQGFMSRLFPNFSKKLADRNYNRWLKKAIKAKSKFDLAEEAVKQDFEKRRDMVTALYNTIFPVNPMVEEDKQSEIDNASSGDSIILTVPYMLTG